MWNKGKHIVEDVNSVRCTVVESNVEAGRADFLKKLLEHNKFKVEVEKIADDKYKIGVTDLMFNPVIDVNKRRLKTLQGKVVEHNDWFQL